MEKYNYSIIIPHKNIPDLLQRCLDSIPQRDDVQVIIVDDNSDPQKVDFEHFPGLGQKNIEVYFDKTGRGAGRARNVGLEHAKGEWVLFADADDFFNYCLNDFLDNYKDSDADIIFCNASSVDSETYVNSDRSQLTNDLVNLYSRDKEKAEFLFRYHQGVPWSKMIRRSLIERFSIQFDETPIVNDTTFAYLSGHKANKILVDSRAIYCITMRGSSITYTMSIEKRLAIIEVFARKYQFLLDNGIEFYESAIPNNMNYFLKTKDESSYNYGLEILRRHGFSEELINKKFFVFENKYSFIHSGLFQEIETAYYQNGITIKIIKRILELMQFLRSLFIWKIHA